MSQKIYNLVASLRKYVNVRDKHADEFLATLKQSGKTDVRVLDLVLSNITAKNDSALYIVVGDQSVPVNAFYDMILGADIESLLNLVKSKISYNATDKDIAEFEAAVKQSSQLRLMKLHKKVNALIATNKDLNITEITNTTTADTRNKINEIQAKISEWAAKNNKTKSVPLVIGSLIIGENSLISTVHSRNGCFCVMTNKDDTTKSCRLFNRSCYNNGYTINEKLNCKPINSEWYFNTSMALLSLIKPNVDGRGFKTQVCTLAGITEDKYNQAFVQEILSNEKYINVTDYINKNINEISTKNESIWCSLNADLNENKDKYYCNSCDPRAKPNSSYYVDIYSQFPDGTLSFVCNTSTFLNTIIDISMSTDLNLFELINDKSGLTKSKFISSLKVFYSIVIVLFFSMLSYIFIFQKPFNETLEIPAAASEYARRLIEYSRIM